MNTDALKAIEDRMNRAAKTLLDNNDCMADLQRIKDDVKKKMEIDPNIDLLESIHIDSMHPFKAIVYFDKFIRAVASVVCKEQQREESEVRDEFYAIYLDENL